MCTQTFLFSEGVLKVFFVVFFAKTQIFAKANHFLVS